MNLKILTLFFGLFSFFVTSFASGKECQMTYARAYSNPEMALQTWNDAQLRKVMSSALQCDIALKAYSSEKKLREDIDKGKINFASLKDFSYYLVKRKHNDIKLIAISLTHRYPTGKLSMYYSGYLLSLKNNDSIQSIDNIAGKRIGFLSPTSTSGFILPYLFLKSKKIQFDKTSRFFNDNDDELYQALLSNHVDIIATWDDVILRNPHTNIKIIKKFKNIPNPPLLAIKPLSAEKLQILQNALVNTIFHSQKNPTKGYGIPVEDMYSDLFKNFDNYCKDLPENCI